MRAAQPDLEAALDALLGNVLAHTPDGVRFDVSLAPEAGGGAVLAVSDEGPGFLDATVVTRGRSGAGSTGLGLDIARRTAEASGGVAHDRRRPGRRRVRHDAPRAAGPRRRVGSGRARRTTRTVRRAAPARVPCTARGSAGAALHPRPGTGAARLRRDLGLLLRGAQGGGDGHELRPRGRPGRHLPRHRGGTEHRHGRPGLRARLRGRRRGPGPGRRDRSPRSPHRLGLRAGDAPAVPGHQRRERRVQAVAHRAGYRFEGVLRGVHFKQGRFEDVEYWSRLVPD